MELADCSPVIIQNSSNPSSRKNLDWSSPVVSGQWSVVSGQWSVVSALGSESDDPVLGLAGARRCALETCGKK